MIRVDVRSERAHLACSLRSRTSLSATGSSSGSKPLWAANLLGQERGDRVVPVLAAQVVVAGSGQHRDVRGCNPGDSHVEGAAAQVVDQDRLASDPCPVQAVGESGGRGLVDDSHDLEAGSVAGLNRRLALGVAEIGGDRDHGAIDGLPQGKLSIGLEPLQHKCRELGRRVGLAVELELVKRRAHVGLEEAGDLRVAQPGPLLGLLTHRGGSVPK